MRSNVGSCERNSKIDVRARGMGCVEERGRERGASRVGPLNKVPFAWVDRDRANEQP